MILITGGTGTIGRPLIDLLVRRGAAVRALTRDAAAANLPEGVEVVEGGPGEPEAIKRATEGVTTVFLHPRAVGPAGADLLSRAKESGAARVVALSAINNDDPLDWQPSRMQGDRNKEAEDAAVASGLDWISLRASSFALNTLRAWGAQIKAGNVVRGPYAAFSEALIDERDVSEACANALMDHELRNRRIPLTGPESLSHEEQVAAIGAAIGRPLSYQEVPAEIAEQGMIQRGLPAPFVQALMARYARGTSAAEAVTNEAGKILGRPATSFATWAADHADAFRG